jgi:ribosomal protein L29
MLIYGILKIRDMRKKTDEELEKKMKASRMSQLQDLDIGQQNAGQQPHQQQHHAHQQQPMHAQQYHSSQQYQQHPQHQQYHPHSHHPAQQVHQRHPHQHYQGQQREAFRKLTWERSSIIPPDVRQARYCPNCGSVLAPHHASAQAAAQGLNKSSF